MCKGLWRMSAAADSKTSRGDRKIGAKSYGVCRSHIVYRTLATMYGRKPESRPSRKRRNIEEEVDDVSSLLGDDSFEEDDYDVEEEDDFEVED
jgi:hypothetical protein